MNRLIACSEKKVFLIVDGHSYHKATSRILWEVCGPSGWRWTGPRVSNAWRMSVARRCCWTQARLFRDTIVHASSSHDGDSGGAIETREAFAH